jgi:hypothetical protein
MFHRSRNPFVESLIGRNESIPQQLSSDGHKGSAKKCLSIHGSEPCVMVLNVLGGGVIVHYDERQRRGMSELYLRFACRSREPFARTRI